MTDASKLSEFDLPEQIDAGLWRRIFGHTRPYKRSMVGLATTGVLMAALDAAFPRLIAALIDGVVQDADASTLVWLGVIYVLVLVAAGVVVFGFISFAGRVATGVAHDLRQSGFARLQELSFSYYDNRPVGWILSRLTSDCMKVSSLMPWVLFDVFWGLSFILLISINMLWMNWVLALAVFGILPLLIAVSFYFQRKLLFSSRMMRRINSQITATFSESIAGVRTTKTLVRERNNLEEFQGQSGSMQDWSVRNALQSAVYLPLIVAIGSLGTAIVLWRGGLDLQTESLTIGELFAFMQYVVLFFIPIQDLARRVADLQAAQAAAERLQGLLDTTPGIRDSEQVQSKIDAHRRRHPDADIGADGGDDRIERIDFRQVDFWYVEGEPVLLGFDLSLRAGETVALVGSTGGGKSTIANLMCRFYEPSGGGIHINDVEYRERSLHWLRSNLGVVLQVPHLFSGSIRDNIAYGRAGATEEEIVSAARRSEAIHFIESLPDAWDTQVGEGGSMLSTGQRQLVALARAILADPQIFVMDEATSSVDTETEQQIQRGIESILSGRISVVIAHRLSTVRNADRILVIDGGRIVESGDHASLLAARGRYFQLYTHQFAVT
jgi:ATP-binding cassette subfamily B protein